MIRPQPLVRAAAACALVTLSLSACPKDQGGSDTASPPTAAPPTTAPPTGASVVLNWNVTAATDLTWSFERDKRLRQGAFTEHDSLTVQLKGAGPESADLVYEGDTARFTVAPDGSFAPDDLSIRLVPQYLLAVAGPTGRAVRVGDSWTVKIPKDGALTQLEKVTVIQQTLTMTVERIEDVGGDTQATLHVTGTQRLLDNAGLRTLIGARGTASQKAEDALSQLAADNYFLDGTATWSTARSAPIKAAFTVAMVPSPRSKVADVERSAYRNEVTYTLR